MASTSAPVASDSSPSMRRCLYDVFLSFRGEDTRYNFTDHLYNRLVENGITSFRDDRLTKGEEIQAELLKAIEKSKSSIVVFSKTYADSRWCLDELSKIMECGQEYGQIVLPVFYHVDPTDVRKQTGSFGEAFTNHEKNWKNKVQRWREALTEAGNIAGWHINAGYESVEIKKIITHILEGLDYKRLYVGPNLVGMDSYLRELTLKLKIQSNDRVRMVGIWGVGGIGKTTIAKAIYNQIAPEFDCISFLEDVKKIHKDKGLHGLQKQLLYDITREKHYLSNISHGANVIQNSLQSRKALIVFDDIDDTLRQLEYLVGDRNWYGSGSIVLITTRDRELLKKFDDLYEVKGLNYKDALELFSLNAFEKYLPIEGYKNLSKCLVDYCQGLPLALKVLGSLLHSKTISKWESELHKLVKIPNAKIQNVLKISYDGLDRTEQETFLDIACFFKGEDTDFVSNILDGCDKMFPNSGLGVLEAKCLVTFSDNKIYMHDLIQQMGWEIIREQHPKDPSKWSRLWNPDDIYHAFMSKKGMKNVETISLELSGSKEIWFTEIVFAKMKKRFAKMEKLRLLKVYYNDHHSLARKEYKTSLPKGFEFPRELRYLHWEGLESLPSNFDSENFVAINLKCSNVKKLWKRKKHHEKLKFVDVSDSQQLIQMPNFSSMPNLERLNIGGCKSIRKLHSSIGAFPPMIFLKELLLNRTGIKELPSSIGYLTSLEILDVSCCLKFQKLPDSFANMRRLRKLYMRNTDIKELPTSIGYLESLESLNLSGCSNFENLPEMVETKCLKELLLQSTAIKELPTSIGSLELLETINLSFCSNFEKFPEIQGNMKCLKSVHLGKTAIKELPSGMGCLEALGELNVSGCSNLEMFPEIQRNMRRLRHLNISGTDIKELPDSIANLTGLDHLDLENCKSLKSLPSSMCKLKSLQRFHLNGCSNLDPEGLREIIEGMENLRHLELGEMAAITEVPSSIGRLKDLRSLRLSNCENLVTANLADSSRSLQFCLVVLDISGCNLEEGAIPSDLWCLFSLIYLDVSGNRIRRIPTGINQLSILERLLMNHCPKLKEIPELPSSLREIQACGCPRLKADFSSCEPTTTDILWSSLLNSFKLYIENLRYGKERYTNFPPIYAVVSGGRKGIPKWVRYQSEEGEVSIELPKKWYKDDSFLGFAFFFHFVPLDDTTSSIDPVCAYFISQGGQFILLNGLGSLLVKKNGYGSVDDEKSFEVLGVFFFPKIGISNEYRSKRWKYFKVCIPSNSRTRTKSCGLHLIYAEAHAQDDHKKRSRTEEDSESHHKRSRHVF